MGRGADALRWGVGQAQQPSVVQQLSQACVPVLPAPIADEARERVDGAQALVARAHGALALAFKVFEKEPNAIYGKIGYRQLLEWPTGMCGDERQ